MRFLRGLKSLGSPLPNHTSLPPHDQNKQVSYEQKDAQNNKWHCQAAFVPRHHGVADSKGGNVLDSIEDHHDGVETRLIDIEQVGEQDGGCGCE